MAIKYLRGIYGRDQVKTTRPVGFKFPLGLTVNNNLNQANSSTTPTGGTFDVLIVAGGGAGGPQYNPPAAGGGGGGGGVRILSANNFSDLPELKNPTFITQTTNFIPVTVGGSGGNSCFGSNFISCRGGSGGRGTAAPFGGFNGNPGGSGGGGARRTGGPAPEEAVGVGGNGIAGEGCNGGSAIAPVGTSGAAGGAATSSASNVPCLCNLNGISTSFTGTPIRYSDGGNGTPTPTNGCAGTANRGHGGNGAAGPLTNGGSGGSGIVAIRYCNPAAPTTPLATGGDCICCTGGCIIHIFTSSGFLNVNSSFSIN